MAPSRREQTGGFCHSSDARPEILTPPLENRLFAPESSYAATDQDLPVLGLSTKPCGEVAYGADRGIAGAFGKTDLPQGRIALRNAGAKAEFIAVAAPGSDQLAGRLAHRHRHLDRAAGRVGARHGVVEQHHDPVTRELIERALELGNEGPRAPWYSRRKSRTFSGSAVSV